MNAGDEKHASMPGAGCDKANGCHWKQRPSSSSWSRCIAAIAEVILFKDAFCRDGHSKDDDKGDADDDNDMVDNVGESGDAWWWCGGNGQCVSLETSKVFPVDRGGSVIKSWPATTSGDMDAETWVLNLGVIGGDIKLVWTVALVVGMII